MAKKGSVKKEGEWARVQRVIGGLHFAMVGAREIGLKQVGLKAEALAVKHMSDQDLGWQALKPETLARKKRKRWSNKTLFETTDYWNSITTIQKSDTVFTGVRKEETYEDGSKIADIAMVHEYGYDPSNIPERPLWRPVFKETTEWIVKTKLFPEEAIKRIRSIK